jgi:ABC-type phosphate transport system substrate-binding protein
MRSLRNMSVRRVLRVPVVALAVAGLAAAAVVVAAPASADPVTTYATVGSDTIQDVMNQFAADQFPGLIGSWDAVNPGSKIAHEIISPKPGCSMTRPNGSGEGLNALRKSINPSTTAPQLASPPSAGCIDFSRSSSGPGSNASVTGALQYVPFALDAVATATGPATAVTGSNPAVATAITQADKFTLGTLTTPGDLVHLYRDCAPITEGGVTYDPNIPAATGDQQIHLYVPQAGSGTRNFWATTLGFSNVTLPSCVHDTIVGSPAPGTPVEEHDGTVFAQDADALGPFSIAQFIAQSNGINDRRHNVALHSLTAAASGGTAQAPVSSGALNTAYPIIREVYVVVLRAKVVNTGTPSNPSPGFDQRLANELVGAGGQLCSDSLTIIQFGFATLDSSPLGHTCGAIADNLRAFDPTTNPI